MTSDRGVHALFVTDFDGTLYRGGGKIHPADLRALEDLGKTGILRAVATGRSLESFRATASDLNLPIDYVVFSSGAGLVNWRTGVVEEAEELEPKRVREIVSVFEDLGLDYMIHEPIPHNHRFYYRTRGRGNDDFKRRCTLYEEYCSPMPDDYLENPKTATQFIAILSEGSEVLAEVRHRLIGYSVVRTTSPLDGRSLWIEVFPLGVSKSSGVAGLCKKFGIPRKRVCATGNDYNDQDLLEWAALSFVPADAPVELRSLFPVIPDSNGSSISGAVAVWLERLDEEINGTG